MGTVTNVVDFGAFVKLANRLDGLVPISEFADHYVDDPYQFVSSGQQVAVKVLEVDEGNKKFRLSMKSAEEVRQKPKKKANPKPKKKQKKKTAKKSPRAKTKSKKKKKKRKQTTSNSKQQQKQSSVSKTVPAPKRKKSLVQKFADFFK